MKAKKLGLLAVIAGIIASTQLAGAQEASTNAAPRHPGKGAAARPGGPIMALFQQLDLTPEQKEKIRPIMRESGQKMRALQQEGALTPEEKLGQLKEIMEATSGKLKTILTPEQFAKYEQLTKEMREKRLAAGGKMRMPGNERPSDLPTNSVPSPGLGQNTN